MAITSRKAKCKQAGIWSYISDDQLLRLRSNELAALKAMRSGVATGTEGYQVLLGVCSRMAAKLPVVHF